MVMAYAGLCHAFVVPTNNCFGASCSLDTKQILGGDITRKHKNEVNHKPHSIQYPYPSIPFFSHLEYLFFPGYLYSTLVQEVFRFWDVEPGYLYSLLDINKT